MSLGGRKPAEFWQIRARYRAIQIEEQKKGKRKHTSELDPQEVEKRRRRWPWIQIQIDLRKKIKRPKIRYGLSEDEGKPLKRTTGKKMSYLEVAGSDTEEVVIARSRKLLAWDALIREYDNTDVLASRCLQRILNHKIPASGGEYSKYCSYLCGRKDRQLPSIGTGK
ncbi:unnamed protein product [Nezara viridula]|uniref:Uncharacterized protein n=1 Tax=Nezara viridula TaxID=85310 RepID=A0A9P0E5R2_NEZVI|nr:unnamed protein product [Nezara viridula]